MKHFVCCCLVLIAIQLSVRSAYSLDPRTTTPSEQDVIADSILAPNSDNFNVGLALSGGGAAGLAHIGVLKVFEEAGIPVDVVSGTSMGAVIGALYAIGYTPELMESEVRKIDWRELFEEPTSRAYLPLEDKQYDSRFLVSFPVENRQVELPSGLVSGNFIFNKLAELTWLYHDVSDFQKLQRPFICVATDLETGEQVVLDRGFLPAAIRASISIPAYFEPVWYDGNYLVDGGVLNNLPVREAFDLGADYVIAVNSSSDLKPADELLTLPDILNQTISIGMRSSMLQQQELAQFHIQPDLNRFSTLGFGEIDEIIAAGEAAARARIDEIRQLADSLQELRQPGNKTVQKYPAINKVAVRSISLEGLETVPADHIYSKLQIIPNSVITSEQLNEGLLRLYGMNRFNQITYELSWDDGVADLKIFFEEQTANLVQTGFHHNSETGPSLLFNATFRNLLFPASNARLNMRLGHETLFEMKYFNYIGLEPRLTFYARTGYQEREIDIYQDNLRQASLRTDLIHAEAMIGPHYASVVRTGIGYRIERFNLTESYGEIEAPVDWNTLQLLTGEFEFDNLNRTHFPTRGQSIFLRADLSPEFLHNDVTFGRLEGKWQTHYSINPVLSMMHALQGGHLYGDIPPLHYRFYTGGQDSFWGYPKDALHGTNFVVFRTAIQYQFYRNFYASSGFNFGETYEQLDLELFDQTPRIGWAAGLGWDTLIGPLKMTLSGSREHRFIYEFQIGLNF